MRWLHIYLSMFGLASVLFFGATGLTLNHPDWFFGESETTLSAKGDMNPKWLRLSASSDQNADVDKYEIVEYLRSHHAIRGAVSDLQVQDNECLVMFKGPGYAADATIDRTTGKYAVNQTLHGVLSIVNDLHKGRDTGPAWSVLIDVSAVLMTAISLTGLILLFYLKLRKKPGLIVGLIGTAAVLAVYWFGVP